MKKVKIGDITEILTGQSAPQDPIAFGESGIPFIRAGSLQGLQNGKREEDFELINQENAKKHRLKLFPKNTVIFAKSGMSAKLGRIYRLKTPSYLVSHLAAILPCEGLNPGYLEKWLFKNPPSRLIPNDAYPSIKISSIASMKIELPELEYQEYVSGILDKADTLRQKRKESIKLLDDFLRSTFLDMFGDPVLNSKNIPIEKLDELTVKIGSGSTPRGGSKIYQKSGIMFIRSQNIHMNRMDLDNIAFITTRIHNNMKNTWVKNGDVLLNITGASIGRVAFFDGKSDSANVNQHVCIIRPIKEKLNPIYLSYMISQINYQNKILGENTGGTREAFNFKK